MYRARNFKSLGHKNFEKHCILQQRHFAVVNAAVVGSAPGLTLKVAKASDAMSKVETSTYLKKSNKLSELRRILVRAS
jgi:hypothetical protein